MSRDDNQMITVKGGTISAYLEMEVTNKKFRFTGNDPQLHVVFPKPIHNIRISWNVRKGDFSESLATLYYKSDNENYSENKTCKFYFCCCTKKTKEIHFESEVTSIRLDLVDFTGECEVEDFSIEVLERISIEKCLEKNLIVEPCDSKDKIVVVTHELSASGAPILAYHIARELQNKGKSVITLTRNCGDGFLKEKYEESNLTVVNLSELSENQYEYLLAIENCTDSAMDHELYLKCLMSVLRKNGYSEVITNTIVSGMYVNILKDYNFKVISLIHEMKTTIEMYGLDEVGRNIANYSDYVVFPNETVQNDFESIFQNMKGECVVRPQGVYLKEAKTNNESKYDLLQYGIDENADIVMSSGTCELRKGVDLYVSVALLLNDSMPESNIHFVWTGNFADKELEGWLKNQIRRAGLHHNIHFIPFIKNPQEYKSLLKQAKVFWAMSREDPFPSTVLEAMKEEIPVVGFKGTGGIEVMLQNSRGVLARNFNLTYVAEQTKSLLNQTKDCHDMVKNAKKYVDELDFETYIDYLIKLLEKDQIIFPGLDCYRWKWNEHYWSRQLPRKTLDEKKAQLRKACIRKPTLFKKVSKDKIVLLDTKEGSDNIGDGIIMDYCMKACQKLLNQKELIKIPTHIYSPKSEKIGGYLKILCGTNLIYTQMEDSRQWALPNDLSGYRNICLLGVGMQQIDIDKPMSEYSKKLIRFMLSSNVLHSVRDEETKLQLEKIGIKNVINTGCPTMWALTPGFCSKIPVHKGRDVLTTVTDYLPDEDNDKYMLELLKENYEKVYIWIQGQKDYDYLKTLVDLEDYILIPPSLEELDSILKLEDLDYVGTRLHAGIRSLNFRHRSYIVSIDNRAKAIARDTNLPIIDRIEIKENLSKLINEDYVTKIRIAVNEIEKWKDQFK